MLTKQSLHSIQSGTDKEMYSLITNIALYISSGGYLEQANGLLSALWSFKFPHERDTWLADTAFMVLWDASGKRPDQIPFTLDAIDSIEKNMRGYLTVDKWAYPIPNVPWQELSGQDLIRKALVTARLVKGGGGEVIELYTVTGPHAEPAADFSEIMARIHAQIQSISVQATDSFPTAAAELEAVAMVQKLVAGNVLATDALVLGAELAARNGRSETAIQLAKCWAEEIVRQNRGMGFPPIATGRHVAPLLLEGVIAVELGLTDEKVAEYVELLLKTLESRRTQGRTLALGNLSWEQLVKRISEEAIRIEEEDSYDEEVRESQWIGFEGASADEIKLAEERLNVKLPEDYIRFLQATNGIQRFPLTNPALLPAERIGYVKEIMEPSLFDLMQSYPPPDGEEAPVWNNLSNALMIGEYPDDQMLWLVPEDKERSKWLTCFYAAWLPGMRIYPSFRYYMEEQLNKMDGYERQAD